MATCQPTHDPALNPVMALATFDVSRFLAVNFRIVATRADMSLPFPTKVLRGMIEYDVIFRWYRHTIMVPPARNLMPGTILWYYGMFFSWYRHSLREDLIFQNLSFKNGKLPK